MNRIAYTGLGLVMGLTASTALTSAFGANNVLSAYRELDLFGDAFERVRASYVRPVEDSELIQNAINGMVSALDPHSRYLTAKDFSDLQNDTAGEYNGVGLDITLEDGVVKVVSPIDDTPAARAGIKPGDYILTINGNSVQGLTLDQASEMLRGPRDSKATLTIFRKGSTKPLVVTLTRSVITVPNVKWRRDGDIGYIRIIRFISEKTNADVQRAIAALKQQIGPARIKGYVLDLRNNPGGLVDQSVGVSDDFLNGGEVVSTRGRTPGQTERYNAGPGDLADGKPVTVLINEGTASAAEIVAGALQDHHRATIIGMTSFGKGSVQTVIPLSAGHGGALWLTTAKYYTPSGHSIQATGIVPDVAVAQLAVADDPTARALESEAALPGHLDAEGEHRTAPRNVIRPAQGKTYDDFQLSYALDRMNGKSGPVVAREQNPATRVQ